MSNIKKTKEQFISESIKVHNNKYDYSLVEYIKSNIKVKIICPIHGEFEQIPNAHLHGQGCSKCSNNRKLTTNEFIERSKEIHNNKYDYSSVNYINSNTKVKIICKKHGVFEQKPFNHLLGEGCSKCSNNKKLTIEEFINRSNIIHNNKYDYSLSKYNGNNKKIKIICPVHGQFEQKSYHHLNGRGCPNCSNNKKSTTEEFINRSNIIHNNKYDYSLVDYKNAHTKIKIICPKHDIFEQTPLSHLKGYGCVNCNNGSKGELIIKKFLEDNNIIFESQKSFKYCVDKRKLKFDFYLPNHNTCIEFDGEQHFRTVKWFGDKDGLKSRQKRDEIKNKYCTINNIYLLRVKYDDDILDILNKIIF